LNGVTIVAAVPYVLSVCLPTNLIALSWWVSITSFCSNDGAINSTLEFKERMHQRSAIEGTISELTRAHGLRRSRYRGFAKVELQNLFIATACNLKRWLQTLVEPKGASDCFLPALRNLLLGHPLLLYGYSH
jgi:DDE family transposase